MDTLQDSEWNNRQYVRRDNYTDVSSDFDKAFDRHASAASSKRAKFLVRSLLTFEKIIHPTYLFGMTYKIISISFTSILICLRLQYFLRCSPASFRSIILAISNN